MNEHTSSAIDAMDAGSAACGPEFAAFQVRTMLLALALIGAFHLGLDLRETRSPMIFPTALLVLGSVVGWIFARRSGAFRSSGHVVAGGLVLAASILQLHTRDAGTTAVAWYALTPLIAGLFCSLRAGMLWSIVCLIAWGSCLKLLSTGLPWEIAAVKPGGVLATMERALPFGAGLLLLYGQGVRFARMQRRVGKAEKHAAAAGLEARETVRHLHEEQSLRGGLLGTLESSHRTPLTGMLGITSMLLKTPLDAEQRGMIEDLRVAATTLRTGLDQIADLTRMASGELEIELAPFDLHSLLADAVQPCMEGADARGVELLLRVHADAPRFLHGDADRIARVLEGLVRRAVDLSQDTDVFVDVAPIGIDAKRTQLRFCVEDGSRNMSLEERTAILESLMRSSPSAVLFSGSTEASFALYKGLAEAMDGELGFQPADENTGTRLWFTLPLQEATETHASSLFAAEFDNIRALVVHPRDKPRQQITVQLRDMGLSAVEADSGREALNMLELASEGVRPFHIALIDENALDLQLSEFLAAVEDRPQLAMTCIVLMASDVSHADTSRLQSGGVSAYLAKPVLPSALKDTVAMAVGLREQVDRDVA